MNVLLKQGKIEIELLRRYGRVPIGTRATGWFRLSQVSGPYFTHSYEVEIPIADDPRPVKVQVDFPWQQDPDQPMTRSVHHREAWHTETVANLYDSVSRDVVRFVEGLNTSAKHQRFRVIRAQWENEGIIACQ